MHDAISQWLLDPAGLTPHGFCLLWEPGLIWTQAISDTVIALAYFTIPAALIVLARRRRDLLFRPLYWLFAAFILLCGTEHLSEVATIWVPAYWLEAGIKLATAAVSAITAVSLWYLLPRAFALPSPAQFNGTTAALRDSEARYRASFERSPVPAYTLDSNGIITGVSDSWLSLLGYAADEAVGRPLSDFTGGLWDRDVVARIEAEGELHDLERRFTRKDGTTIETLVSIRAERPGGTNWVNCVLVDISARREAEKALRASEERLHQAQKMDAVGQLTGGIAHDFNNILQGIGGSLDLMERRIQAGNAEDAGRYLVMARQSIDRAAGLTHRMLAFARRQALQPRDISPATLINGMEELIRRTVGPGVRLVLYLSAGDWHARCDPNQLESALLNLAINARDAMPGTGLLTITLADRRVEPGSLPDLPELAAGDYVEISVTDTGAGMPPDVLARAFEPFFTTKPTGRGTGLGLSQIYGFVRQSGGMIRLESSPGEGTTVRLLLPRHAQPVFLPADSASIKPAAGKKVRGTVLLVEDEEKIRAVIAAALTDVGCHVLQAEDGTAGLAIVQSRARFDMLLTDVGLPGLNGRQLADAARERNPALPVLLITGYAGSAFDDMALSPGMELLRKPFAMDSLTAQVSTMLDGVLPVESARAV